MITRHLFTKRATQYAHRKQYGELSSRVAGSKAIAKIFGKERKVQQHGIEYPNEPK